MFVRTYERFQLGTLVNWLIISFPSSESLSSFKAPSISYIQWNKPSCVLLCRTQPANRWGHFYFWCCNSFCGVPGEEWKLHPAGEGVTTQHQPCVGKKAPAAICLFLWMDTWITNGGVGLMKGGKLPTYFNFFHAFSIQSIVYFFFITQCIQH